MNCTYDLKLKDGTEIHFDSENELNNYIKENINDIEKYDDIVFSKSDENKYVTILNKQLSDVNALKGSENAFEANENSILGLIAGEVGSRKGNPLVPKLNRENYREKELVEIMNNNPTMSKEEANLIVDRTFEMWDQSQYVGRLVSIIFQHVLKEGEDLHYNAYLEEPKNSSELVGKKVEKFSTAVCFLIYIASFIVCPLFFPNYIKSM